MKQGLLGDCWFLCACAALQKSQHLLDQVSATARLPLRPLLPVCPRWKEAGGSQALALWGSALGGSEAQMQ